MLVIKNIVPEMKNAFNEFTNTFNRVKKESVNMKINH